MTQFVRVCHDLLAKAKAQGATLRELHTISRSAGCPRGTLGNFTVAFYTAQR